MSQNLSQSELGDNTYLYSQPMDQNTHSSLNQNFHQNLINQNNIQNSAQNDQINPLLHNLPPLETILHNILSQSRNAHQTTQNAPKNDVFDSKKSLFDFFSKNQSEAIGFFHSSYSNNDIFGNHPNYPTTSISTICPHCRSIQTPDTLLDHFYVCFKQPKASSTLLVNNPLLTNQIPSRKPQLATDTKVNNTRGIDSIGTGILVSISGELVAENDKNEENAEQKNINFLIQDIKHKASLPLPNTRVGPQPNHSPIDLHVQRLVGVRSSDLNLKRQRFDQKEIDADGGNSADFVQLEKKQK